MFKRERKLRTVRSSLALVVCAFALSTHARAEQLPVRVYTTAGGLAHDQVNVVTQDSRGFIWFCTVDGLSRFDGYRFTNYGVKDGLAVAPVNDMVEPLVFCPFCGHKVAGADAAHGASVAAAEPDGWRTSLRALEETLEVEIETLIASRVRAQSGEHAAQL